MMMMMMMIALYRVLLTCYRIWTEFSGESTNRNVRRRFVVHAPRLGRQLRQYLFRSTTTTTTTITIIIIIIITKDLAV